MTTSKRKPEVGEELTITNTGNRLRGGRTADPRSCVVMKVGRKYFWVAEESYQEERYKHCWVKFRIEDWREDTDYSSCYILYEDLQAYFDEKERVRWMGTFRKAFDHFSRHKYTLQQYRDAAAIFDIKIEED